MEDDLGKSQWVVPEPIRFPFTPDHSSELSWVSLGTKEKQGKTRVWWESTSAATLSQKSPDSHGALQAGAQ